MNVDVLEGPVMYSTGGREFPAVWQAVVDLRVVTAVWIRDYAPPKFYASLDRST
jgi:hypothetical protein